MTWTEAATKVLCRELEVHTIPTRWQGRVLRLSIWMQERKLRPEQVTIVTATDRYGSKATEGGEWIGGTAGPEGTEHLFAMELEP